MCLWSSLTWILVKCIACRGKCERQFRYVHGVCVQSKIVICLWRLTSSFVASSISSASEHTLWDMSSLPCLRNWTCSCSFSFFSLSTSWKRGREKGGEGEGGRERDRERGRERGREEEREKGREREGEKEVLCKQHCELHIVGRDCRHFQSILVQNEEGKQHHNNFWDP